MTQNIIPVTSSAKHQPIPLPHLIGYRAYSPSSLSPGADPGGAPGARTPLTTKNEAPAPKFYKIEAQEWQF